MVFPLFDNFQQFLWDLVNLFTSSTFACRGEEGRDLIAASHHIRHGIGDAIYSLAEVLSNPFSTDVFAFFFLFFKGTHARK